MRSSTRLLAALTLSLAVHGLLAWGWRMPPTPARIGVPGVIRVTVLAQPQASFSAPDAPRRRQRAPAGRKAASREDPAPRADAAPAQASRAEPRRPAAPRARGGSAAPPASAAPMRGQADGAGIAQAAEQAPDGDAATTVRWMTEAAQQWFRHRIRYPWLARRMGWEGRVELEILVRARRVTRAQLVHPSGHAVLDRAALAGVAGAEGAPIEDGRWRLFVRFALR